MNASVSRTDWMAFSNGDACALIPTILSAMAAMASFIVSPIQWTPAYTGTCSLIEKRLSNYFKYLDCSLFDDECDVLSRADNAFEINELW